MRKLSKVTISFLLLLFLAMPLIAKGQEEAAPTGDEPVTITWWHLWGGSRTELIDQIVADYTADHPNVSFDITFTPPMSL